MKMAGIPRRPKSVEGLFMVGIVLSCIFIFCIQPAVSASVIEEPKEVYKRHAQRGGNMAYKKMCMLLGTSFEDRVVRMKNLHSIPAMETALDTTPEQDKQNTIEDMKDVMKMEKKETGGGKDDEFLMSTFEDTVMDNEAPGKNNNGGITDDLRQRINEFLAIAGIDTVLPLDCGKNPQAPEDPLRVGLAPWIAALGYLEDSRFKYHCIGVVISRYHILTDADCAGSSNVNVVLLNVTSAPSTSRNAIVNYVAGRRVHPRIQGVEDLIGGNNIGILELVLPIEFNDDVQPACLPGQTEEPEPYEQKNSTLLFFRFVDVGTERDASLFFMRDSPYLGSAQCYVEVKDISSERPTTLHNILTKNHFCIVRNFEGVGKSVVLEVDERTGRVKLIGVGGIANAALSFPIAYTHTQPHRFWVELVLRKFRDNVMKLE